MDNWIEEIRYNRNDINDIYDKKGFTGFAEGFYSLRILYKYKNNSLTFVSNYSNVVLVQPFSPRCDIEKIYVPTTYLKDNKNVNVLDINWLGRNKIKITIPKKQLDMMYTGFKNLCTLPATNSRRIGERWILTNIYIYIRGPSDNSRKKKFEKYAIFYNTNDKKVGIIPTPSTDNKKNYLKDDEWKTWLAKKDNFDDRWEFTNSNPIYVYDIYDTVRDLNVGPNNTYKNKESWPWSRGELTKCELTLDDLQNGLYQISWGYEFYHETTTASVTGTNENTLDDKLFVGYDENSTSSRLYGVVSKNNNLYNIDWDSTTENSDILRYEMINVPSYYIPEKPVVTYIPKNVDSANKYDPDEEYLIVDISNIVRGERVFDGINNSLTTAVNNDTLDPYYIFNFKIHSWKPGDWSWYNKPESYFDEKGKFKNKFRDDNIGPAKNVKIYTSSTEGEININPNGIWSCGSLRNTVEPQAQLKIKNPYDGEYNFIWGYDYITSSGETYESEIDVYTSINTNELKLLLPTTGASVVRSHYLPEKIEIEYIKGTDEITYKLSKESLYHLKNNLKKKYYQLENVYLIYLLPDKDNLVDINEQDINEQGNNMFKTKFQELLSKRIDNQSPPPLSEFITNLPTTVSTNVVKMDLQKENKKNWIKTTDDIDDLASISKKFTFPWISGTNRTWCGCWYYTAKKVKTFNAGSVSLVLTNDEVKYFHRFTINNTVNIDEKYINFKTIDYRDSGYFDLYLPIHPIVINYNDLYKDANDSIKDIITLQIPADGKKALESMMALFHNTNTNKPYNFDEFGASIDYIFYYWTDEAKSPLNNTATENQKNNMFSATNRLVIPGPKYPNTLKFKKTKNDHILPNKDEFILDVSNIKFTKTFIGIWTYKLKASGFMSGQHISAHTGYNMFTPSIQSLKNNIIKYPFPSVRVNKKIYSITEIFRFYIPKVLEPFYFKQTNILYLKIKNIDINMFYKNIERNYNSDDIIIKNILLYTWSQDDFNNIKRDNNNGEDDKFYEKLFNNNKNPISKYQWGKREKIINVEFQVNNSQNGKTRACWLYEFEYTDLDKKRTLFSIDNLFKVNSGKKINLDNDVRLYGHDNLNEPNEIKKKGELLKLKDFYKNVFTNSVEIINTERFIPRYFIHTPRTPLIYKYDCKMNILTITIEPSEITKLKTILMTSFFNEVVDKIKVKYELYEIAPLQRKGGGNKLTKQELSNYMKSVFNYFDYDLSKSKNYLSSTEGLEDIDIIINKYDVIELTDDDDEDSGFFPKSTGWSLPYTKDKEKEGAWSYFWTYKIVAESDSNSVYFSSNSEYKYEPLLPPRPILYKHKKGQMDNYESNVNYSNLFFGYVGFGRPVFNMQDYITTINLTTLPFEYFEPQFLKIYNEPLLFNGIPKTRDFINITFPRKQFLDLQDDIFVKFIAPEMDTWKVKKEKAEKRNAYLSVKKKGDLEYYTFSKYIKIHVYLYNIFDNIDIINDNDFLDKMVNEENRRSHIVLTLDKILMSEEFTLEKQEIENKTLMKLWKTKNKEPSIKNILSDEEKKTREEPYQNKIKNHEEWEHQGWGCFYNYNIDLDLEIFNEINAIEAAEAAAKEAAIQKTLALISRAEKVKDFLPTGITPKTASMVHIEAAEAKKKEAEKEEEAPAVAQVYDKKDNVIPQTDKAPAVAQVYDKKDDVIPQTDKAPAVAQVDDKKDDVIPQTDKAPVNNNENKYQELLISNTSAFNSSSRFRAIDTFVPQTPLVGYTPVQTAPSSYQLTPETIVLVKQPSLKKKINTIKYYQNYCPITVEPKISILPYKMTVYKSFFNESQICKIGNRVICSNNVPIHIKKISQGSINTKKMRYSNLMKMNKKQISNVIKSNTKLEINNNNTNKEERNTILIYENNKEYIKKQNKSIKDKITRDENKFC